MRALVVQTLALAAALAVLPGAVAQSQLSTTTTQVAVSPSGGGTLEHGALASFPAAVTYAYPGTGQLELAGTVVVIEVAEAPSWLTVVASPGAFVLPVAGHEMVHAREAMETFEVQMHVHPDAPADATATVTIRAVASPNGNLDGSAGEATFPVSTGAPPTCPASVLVDAVGSGENATEPELVEAHSRTARTFAGGHAAVFGFAAVGACVGGVLGFRRHSP